MKLATMLDDGGLSNQLSEYFCKRISIYFGLMFYILFDFFFYDLCNNKFGQSGM